MLMQNNHPKTWAVDQSSINLCVALIALGFILWFPSLSDYSIGIDQELAAAEIALINWVEQGSVGDAYIDNFINPNRLMSDSGLVLQSILFEMLRFYSGSEPVFAIRLSVSGNILMLGLCGLAWSGFSLSHKGLSFMHWASG